MIVMNDKCEVFQDPSNMSRFYWDLIWSFCFLWSKGSLLFLYYKSCFFFLAHWNTWQISNFKSLILSMERLLDYFLCCLWKKFNFWNSYIVNTAYKNEEEHKEQAPFSVWRVLNDNEFCLINCQALIHLYSTLKIHLSFLTVIFLSQGRGEKEHYSCTSCMS